MKQYYVYIIFSGKKGTLYIGVTSDLIKRMWQHKNKVADGFTKKYGIDKLGYYEIFGDIELAIKREKSLKKFYRKDKIALIEKNNYKWEDLYYDINGSPALRAEDDNSLSN